MKSELSRSEKKEERERRKKDTSAIKVTQKDTKGRKDSREGFFMSDIDKENVWRGVKNTNNNKNKDLGRNRKN